MMRVLCLSVVQRASEGHAENQRLAQPFYHALSPSEPRSDKNE